MLEHGKADAIPESPVFATYQEARQEAARRGQDGSDGMVGQSHLGRDGAKTVHDGLISASGSAPNRPDETFSERQAANLGDMTTYFVLMRLPWMAW